MQGIKRKSAYKSKMANVFNNFKSQAKHLVYSVILHLSTSGHWGKIPLHYSFACCGEIHRLAAREKKLWNTAPYWYPGSIADHEKDLAVSGGSLWQ